MRGTAVCKAGAVRTIGGAFLHVANVCWEHRLSATVCITQQSTKTKLTENTAGGDARLRRVRPSKSPPPEFPSRQ